MFSDNRLQYGRQQGSASRERLRGPKRPYQDCLGHLLTPWLDWEEQRSSCAEGVGGGEAADFQRLVQAAAVFLAPDRRRNPALVGIEGAPAGRDARGRTNNF